MFVITPPAQPSIAVEGTQDRFPVRRIYCVGRNYAAHAREMGNDPDREPPFFFSKPADTVLDSGATMPYPPLTQDLHYEIELVVAIGRGGANIPAAEALDHIYGYAVGIDMTRRDLQAEAKKMGRPWDFAKGFDLSAPCAPIVPVERSNHPGTGRIWLAVNGTIRQDADLAELIWPIPDVISILSASIALAPGDLIYTGTPAGVGGVARGDVLTGGIEGIGEIETRIG